MGMDEPKNIQSEADIFRFFVDMSNHQLVNFNNQMHRLIKNEAIWSEKELEKGENSKHDSHKLNYNLEMCRNLFPGYLSTGVFLMFFSRIEEWLHRLQRHFAKTIDLDDKYHGVKKFKPVLQSINIELGNLSAWNMICDYAIVRDSIMHANGRIGHSRGKNVLERMASTKESGVTIQGGIVSIDSFAVRKLFDSFEQLLAAIPDDVST